MFVCSLLLFDVFVTKEVSFTMPTATEALPDKQKEVSDLISQLKNGEDATALSKALTSSIQDIGLTKDQFDDVLDIVMDGAISITQRNNFIQCLLPNGKFQLKSALLHRIISSIGTQEVHYKRGVKQKLKVFPVSTQQKLLEWIVCSLHLFEKDAYPTLSRMFPILFNLLSYEFLRPSIANLIFLAILNSTKFVESQLNKHHQMYAFKPWHVQLVVDLFLKFPLDNSLKSLLVLFKSVAPSLDLNSFCRDNTIYDFLSLSLSDSVFSYPNTKLLGKLNHIAESRNVEKNLKLYESFSRSSVKRRRRNQKPEPEIDLDTLEFDTFGSSIVSINEITSNLALINNLENIRFINISGLFAINRDTSNFLVDKYKRLFLIIHSLFSKDLQSLNKLECYIRFSILDDNLSVNDLNSLVEEVSGFLLLSSGYLSLKCVTDFLAFKYDSRARNPKSHVDSKPYENIIQRLKLLKFTLVNDETVMEFIDNIVFFTNSTLANRGKAEVIKSTSIELSTLFSIWYLQTETNTTAKKSVFRIVNHCIPKMYQVFETHFNSIPLSSRILIFKLFRFLKSIRSSDLAYLEDNSVFVPPSLAYQIMMASHPLFISQFSGYLSHFKAHQYTDSNKQSTQSSYVLDIINFIWRDKAFQPSQDNSAFSLPSSLINKLRTLSIFNNINLIKLNTAGNLFHNPGFSLITTEILWSLEDRLESLVMRHAGPITEESVSNLSYNNRGEWLDLSYDELRLKILRRLDGLGYTGLCDLLFGSLKTLRELRN